MQSSLNQAMTHTFVRKLHLLLWLRVSLVMDLQSVLHCHLHTCSEGVASSMRGTICAHTFSRDLTRWSATVPSHLLRNILAAALPLNVPETQQRPPFPISVWHAGRRADGSRSLRFLWIRVGGWLTTRLAFPQRHKEWQKLRKTKAH